MAEFESTLLKVLLGIASKLNYENVQTTIKTVSSGGANYTSELFEATILAPGYKKINMFAKVAAVDEKTRKTSITSENIYKTEIYWYSDLLKKYRDMEIKFNVPDKHRLATAKFYGASKEYLKETVVLENLKIKSFETFDRFKSMDLKYAEESIRQLAKFHALSIAFSIYDPDGFEETKAILKTKFDLNSLSEMVNNVLNNALQVVKVRNKHRLSSFIQSRIKSEDFGDFLKPIRRSMIIHGDYRLSNLMYKFNDDGAIEVIPLDYQNIRHGSPLVDLFYLIFTGSDKKFRDQHYTSAVELYYTELCHYLRRLYVDPDEVYSREDFEYEYKKFLPYGLEISIFMLFVITVKTDNSTKDRGLSTFALKPNELYKERINDIIEDFIKMGVL